MTYIISGIQQIGLGNSSVYETWEWYRTRLGMDLPIFDEKAEAALMLPYTEGEKRSRHAVLAMNYQGGGGLEIWQYTSRVPVGPASSIRLGDLGIQIVKYKSPDLNLSFKEFKNLGVELLSEIHTNPAGLKSFFAKDLDGNWIEVTEGLDWYTNNISHSGGIVGATIGVSSIDNSLAFYQDIVGYDLVLSDETNVFPEFEKFSAGPSKFRRVILTHKKRRIGPFSNLLGATFIELIQNMEIEPVKIFQKRMWGDLGYIHLCFDVRMMDSLKEVCCNSGFHFTVDSADSFDMGEAAGRFSYTEDPDGTLIEFVEAHKIPLIKKIGWYLNLSRRSPEKPLHPILLWAMSLSRVKSPVI